MFRSTIPLGRYAGVAIGAHWSVAIVLALISWLLGESVLPGTAPGHAGAWYWLAAILTAVLFMASLLAHELTHALVARHYDMKVKRITLWMLGGAAELEGEPPSPKADLLIAVSGPVASLLIGGASFGLAALTGGWLPVLAATGLAWLGITNLILGVFNLLPGAPLDGGRVLRAVVWKRTGDRDRAVRVAALTGQGLGIALVTLGLVQTFFLGQLTGLWLAFVGWFLVAAAQTEVVGGLARGRLGDLRLRAIMDPEPVPAPGWWTVEAFVTHTAGTARRRVFPVVSFDGHPVAVVSLAELTRLTPQQRLVTRVSDACRAKPRFAAPEDKLVDVLTRTTLRARADLLLVVEDGRLAGTVSADDVARTLELSALGGHNVAA